MPTVRVDMKCLKPINMRDRTVGCGQCMPCRINRGRVWTGRLLLESLSYPPELVHFVTFTYSGPEMMYRDCSGTEFRADSYASSLAAVTSQPTLWKRDGVLFRKRLNEGYGATRFFWCGEYGEEFERPHYHAVFFGSPDPEPTAIYQKLWPHGFVSVGYFTVTRARYVVGYVATKLNGKAGDAAERLRLLEYSQMSRRPALADNWLRECAAWLKGPGASWLRTSQDVPVSFHAFGQHWPLGDRHRRILRSLVGLPERRVDLVVQNPAAYRPPEPIPGEEELERRRILYAKQSARRAIFTSQTVRV